MGVTIATQYKKTPEDVGDLWYAVCVASVRLTNEPGESGNATASLGANPNRLLLDGRSHGAIVTGARLEEDLESFLHTS